MIAIIDCNNFYVSCELLFRPDLKGKPVVVLSNNDGCVISRSQEAKALNVEMGTPLFMARELFKKHDISVFSSNYTLYGDISARVIECIDRHCNQVEVYSVDEAFAQLNKDPKLAYKEAVIIRKQILQWTGIPVKIGIAKSKTLAKICAKRAKATKEGVYMISDEQQVEELLKETPIDKVWGIGRGLNRQLATIGIKSAYDYSQLNQTLVRQQWGVVGLRLLRELNNISCYPVTMQRKPRKQVLTSRSFSNPVKDLTSLKEAVSHYTEECVHKLRKSDLTTSSVGVYVQMYGVQVANQYEAYKTEMRLLAQTDNPSILTKEAIKLLSKLYCKGRRYKKVGVYFNELKHREAVQHSFFDSENREKTKKLANSIDDIRKRFGKSSIQLASSGTKKPWIMRADYRSKRRTTNRNEIMKIN